jgi:hypothetical protein
LFDAVEWCLTGSIQESLNRKISDYEFIKNKFCDESDDPYAEIIFDKCSYQRNLKGKNTTFDFQENSKVCFIESTRIEKFVIDTKNNLWQRFSGLLGFEKLIHFDKQLEKLKSESEKNIRLTLDRIEEETLGLNAVDEEIRNCKNVFEMELGAEWLTIIEDKIDELSESERYLKLEKLCESFKIYLALEKEYEYNDNILKEKEQDLKKESEKIPTSELSKIINEAYQYFDKVKNLKICPICGQKIEFEMIFSRVKQLRASLDNITSFERQISELSQKMSTNKNLLDTHYKVLKETYHILFGEKLSKDIGKKEILEIISLEMKDIILEKERLSKKVNVNKKIGVFNEKIKLYEKTQSSLEKLRAKHDFLSHIDRDIELFHKEYNNRYLQNIKSELDRISRDEVVKIYNSINKSENESVVNIQIEPDIEQKEITFLAQIKGTSRIENAVDFLSTGHLRCLGFALLIARIKARANNLEFILIDDPIYAIDHEHRYNLINYLKDLGNSYQLLITSSDRLFFDLFRNGLNGSKFVACKTEVSIEDGIANYNFLLHPNQFIDEAREHLKKNDFRAASLYARLSLEQRLFFIADKLNINIPFSRIRKVSIKDIHMGNISAKLKGEYVFSWSEIPGNGNRSLIKFLTENFDIDWVKTAKIEKIDVDKTIKIYTEKNFLLLKLTDKETEVILEIDGFRTDEFIAKKENDVLNIYKRKNPGKESEIDRQFQIITNHRYFKSLLKGSPLNEEVHYPHETRKFYSKNEIKDAIESVQKFREFTDTLKMSND